MTRPVYEPSLPREDARLGFGSDQLFRRPSRGAGGGMPGFHGHKESNLTVVSGTQGQILWDEWIIDDDTVFEAGVISGSDLTEVKYLQEGWYATYAWAAWSAVAQPATGFGGLAFVYDDTDFAEPNYHMMGVTYPVNFSSGPSMTIQEVRCFPSDFTQTQSFAWVNRLELWVIQNSGVNRTLVEAYLNIVYLGPRESNPSS